MSINYVQFRDPVDVGGKHNSLRSWSRDKHETTIGVARDGGMIVLSPEGSTEEYEVPMTNVIYIRRKRAAKPDAKAKP